MPTKNTMTIDNIFARMVVAVPKKPAAELVALKSSRRKVERLNPEKFFGFENVGEFKEGALEKLNGQEEMVIMAAKGYQEIDYSFLAWRKKNTRLPAFIVLDLDSNTFSLSVDDDEDYEFEPDLPEAIANQFEKVIQYLGKRAERESENITISADFQGIMPPEARAAVVRAQKSELFNSIFVIAEAPKTWNIERTARVYRDPLVVGWVEDTEKMYLITRFNATELEKYVEEQYVK